MKLNFLLSIAMCVWFSFFCSSFALAQVIISDGDFSPSNWEDAIYYQDTGTSVGSSTTEPGDGNPGAHREMTLQWNTGGGTAAIYVFCKYNDASYNPSVQGAITSINYSQDGRITSDSANATNTLAARMALIQNGTIYRSRVVSTVQSPTFPGPWTNLTLNGLRATNFPKAVASDPGPDYPDFAATGSEIFFGYVCAGSTGVAVREIGIGIDNWSVTINQPADAVYTISKTALDGTGAAITTADVGDSITYRLTLTNTGGVDLTGIEVIDTLPENLQYNGTTATPAVSVTHNPGPPETVTWPVGAVATGGSASLDIDMTILVGADQQVLTNQAEVAAIDAPAAAGQTASVDLAVGDVIQADIEVVETTVERDNTYYWTYRIWIRNNGPDATEGVKILYQLSGTSGATDFYDVTSGNPIGDLFICEDIPGQNQFSCVLPSPNTIDPGESAVHFTRVHDRMGLGIGLSATVTATIADPDATNNDGSWPHGRDVAVGSVEGGGGGCFISRALGQYRDRR